MSSHSRLETTFLASLGRRFVVRHPPELRDALRRPAERIAQAANQAGDVLSD